MSDVRAYPEHYREWVHDHVHPNGWVNRGVVGPEFYEPLATHRMYTEFDTLPPFASVAYQARERLEMFYDQGYSPIAGILIVRTMSVQQAIHLLEKGPQYIRDGALVGPYFSEARLMNGVRLFMR